MPPPLTANLDKICRFFYAKGNNTFNAKGRVQEGSGKGPGRILRKGIVRVLEGSQRDPEGSRKGSERVL